MTIRRTRLSIAIAAIAAALVTAALMATAGSAQAPAGTTLHLVSKSQKGVGFFPSGRPHQGEHLGFGDTITGDDSGYDRAACTIVGRSPVCTIQVQLSKGTLSVQGIAPQRSNNTPFAIVGGTGAYDGATGTALVTDVNSNTTNITINLK
jgi:Dirigent-like protein